MGAEPPLGIDAVDDIHDLGLAVGAHYSGGSYR